MEREEVDIERELHEALKLSPDLIQKIGEYIGGTRFGDGRDSEEIDFEEVAKKFGVTREQAGGAWVLFHS